MDKFMELAVREAKEGVRKGEGGPFGAVVVLEGKVVASAHNEVVGGNDPTAHAEMLAIRKASAALGKSDLSGCALYTTCEPCPMCFAAIEWAHIGKVVYGCTRQDAAKIGFDDNKIYEILSGKQEKDFKLVHTGREECLEAFKQWERKKDKVLY